MSGKVALISCSSKKITTTAPAKDLYISPLFKKSYAFANYVGCDEIYILSAKYGMIPDTQIISPYDMTLKTYTKEQKKEWSMRVNKKITEYIPERSRVLLLAGEDYIRFLDFTKHIPYNPLVGLGIGRRLHYLNNILSNKNARPFN